MLSSLHVQNLALVERAAIEFEAGLNVITGETGAGKSLLIGALKLLLGERADKSLIRSGAGSCSVEAQFDLPAPGEVDALLAECEISPCEDGLLIIRRVIKAAGGGRVLVNDHPVTLQLLKRIGELLVDMHGPYDHQSLLHRDAQLRILDAFGGHHKEQKAWAAPFEAMLELQARREGLSGDEAAFAEQVDLLRYRVQEIEAAALKEEEEEEILEEHGLQANAQRILELTAEASTALENGDASAFDQLVVVQRAFAGLARLLPEAEDWLAEAEGIANQLRELNATLGARVGALDAEPARLAWLEERRTIYDQMKRKYGGSVTAVLENFEASKQRLHELEHREEQLAEIDAEIEQVRAKLETAGRALGKKRKAAGRKLAKAITAHLQDLGFPGGEFAVELEAADARRSGMDEIDFGFAPNPGEPMQPLRQIASSGEIARVMLAIKAVLAEHDQVPVLIFDEIDSNVGGEMGSAIGAKLAGVAKHHQIIAITHLPQVATHGGHHLAVRKATRQKRTVTEVDLLESEARVEEIARMLGGKKLTPVTMDHARELLKVAGK